MALQIRFLSFWLNLRLISTLIWNNDAENESFVCSAYKSTSLKTNSIFPQTEVGCPVSEILKDYYKLNAPNALSNARYYMV